MPATRVLTGILRRWVDEPVVRYQLSSDIRDSVQVTPTFGRADTPLVRQHNAMDGGKSILSTPLG